jgi:hypothetical protein
MINGVPSTSGGTLPTVAPTATLAPTPSAVATASPAPTAVPNCLVPDLKFADSSTATAAWVAAGFSASNLAFNPLVPPHYTIKKQTLTKAKSVPCDSGMTVAP